MLIQLLLQAKTIQLHLGGETKTASVTGLGTGTYTVCFKVDGQDAYEQCFEVNIGEPKALSVFIDVDNDNRTTSIQLSGSSILQRRSKRSALQR